MKMLLSVVTFVLNLFQCLVHAHPRDEDSPDKIPVHSTLNLYASKNIVPGAVEFNSGQPFINV